MTSIEKQIKKLGLVLPNPSTPGGNYSSCNTRGNNVSVAIQFPIKNEEFLYQGKLGADLDTEAGYQAMRLCGLNVLAQINKYFDLENIEGLNHVDIYYRSADNWDDAPKVANGASDLFVEVLGEKGQHSRAIIGVHALPRQFSVGLSATLTLRRRIPWIFA
jgi:enamine deaminase RidA (YjgF/YER057c/UK114 family)